LKPLALGLLALLLANPLPAAAQRIDPDWCLTCKDSRLHFVAGAAVGVGARLVLPKAKPWQRILVTATIGLAYELGQEGVARNEGLAGRGYGIGPKDLLLDVAGATLVELILKAGR
jgi:hypothetical protein